MNERCLPMADCLFDEAEATYRYAYASTRAEAIGLQRRVAASRAVEPSKGYFARSEYYLGLSERARAMHLVRAMARSHPDYVFSSYSAALVHGLQVPYALLDTVHLARGDRCNRRLRYEGIVCHKAPCRPFEVIDGIRVTPLDRTVLDCLCQTDFAQGLAIADSALHEGMISKAELIAFMVRNGTRRKGVSTARRVAAAADSRSENGGESMARATMIELGSMIPELQVELDDPLEPGRVYRVDFLWVLPDGTVVVGELDGGWKYVSKGRSASAAIKAMRKERLRESRLSLTGVKVLRFSYEQAIDRAYMQRLLTCAGIPMRAT